MALRPPRGMPLLPPGPVNTRPLGSPSGGSRRATAAATGSASGTTRMPARLGVYWPLRSGNLADGVRFDAPVVVGGLEDAVQQRPASHYGVVADAGAQLVLPLPYGRHIDRSELPVPEERHQVQPEAGLGGLQRSRAEVRVDRPGVPPLSGPLGERLLT